jgi:hypothetical protein
MAAERIHQTHQPKVPRQPLTSTEDRELQPREHASVLHLQRAIGNQGVQALLRQGTLQVQRKCSCPACTGSVTVAEAPSRHLQRFWDDEGEEDSADSGSESEGSWLDSAAEEVGSWFGGDETSSEADSGESSTESESEGSWLDSAAEELGSWLGGGETSSDTESSTDQETEQSEDSDTEVVGEIDAVEVDCEVEEGIGFGSGQGQQISLHGTTDANYNHGRPVPAPFPSGVTVTTGTVGKQKQAVFSANGTFDVTFQANPSVTLPSVPNGLKPCQEEAARKFINGPLAAHEQDHVKAFKDNYDGTFTASVNVSNILDTPEMRKRAMENPVNTEDQQRTSTANAASAKLDPWKQTIPGMDCEK